MAFSHDIGRFMQSIFRRLLSCFQNLFSLCTYIKIVIQHSIMYVQNGGTNNNDGCFITSILIACFSGNSFLINFMQCICNLCCNFCVIFYQSNIYLSSEVKRIKVNGVEMCKIVLNGNWTVILYLLVCRLFPAVIFATAANINGVTSLPLIPALSASDNAFAMDSLMTASKRKMWKARK